MLFPKNNDIGKSIASFETVTSRDNEKSSVNVIRVPEDNNNDQSFQSYLIFRAGWSFKPQRAETTKSQALI